MHLQADFTRSPVTILAQCLFQANSGLKRTNIAFEIRILSSQHFQFVTGLGNTCPVFPAESQLEEERVGDESRHSQDRNRKQRAPETSGPITNAGTTCG
jgi:hypothetical protein